MQMRRFLLAATTAILFVTTMNAAELSAADLDKRRKALSDLINERWEWGLKTSPEFASFLGDKRYNDQVSEISEAEVQRELAVTKKFLARIEKIDTTGFSEQERVNKVLLEEDLRHDVDDSWMKGWEMPLNQMGGIHLQAAQFPSYLSFTSVKDYDDFAKRMRAFPKQIDGTIANMRRGMHDHLMPPKFLLEKVGTQIDELANTPADKSPWFQPPTPFRNPIAPASAPTTSTPSTRPFSRPTASSARS